MGDIKETLKQMTWIWEKGVPPFSHTPKSQTKQNKTKLYPILFMLSYLERHFVDTLASLIHEDPLSMAHPLSSTGKSHQVEDLEGLLMEK
jgi:hypothetical protein